MSYLPANLRHLTAEAFALDAERMAPLAAVRDISAALRQVVGTLDGLAPAGLRPSVEALSADLAALRPRVALVGQVKAGKSALVNAVLGMPDFLPSDVNPWTSVVTSVHVNAAPEDGSKAVFRFFDDATWARIVDHGGRLGELAERADADEEGEALRAQVDDLRRRTAERLGRNYHMLLGRTHRFSEVTPALVRRYVCLGDEADADAEREGRFADLTCSADLHVDAPEFAIPMTIEDTPGVNDPFLLREQMTIDVLGRASVCVLVLSAYQALTVVDLGLVRLLQTLRDEQVVIFVNRVDELSDRAAEVPRIERMIRENLSAHGVGAGVEIVFGSADWTHKAAMGDLDALTALDRAALAEAGIDATDRRAVQAGLRELSGVGALKALIARRVASGPATREILSLARRARDLIAQTDLQLREVDATRSIADECAATDRLDALVAEVEGGLRYARRVATGAVEALRGTVVEDWIERTLPAVTDDVAESVDTAALVPAMVSAYDEIAADARARIDAVMQHAETGLRDLYADLLPKGAAAFPIHRCHAPEFPRPTGLARSTSFDLKGSWTDRLRRAGARAELRAKRFRDTADRELRDTLSEVERLSIGGGFSQAFTALHGFVAPHALTLQGLAAAAPSDAERSAFVARHAQKVAEELGALADRIDLIETALAGEGR